MRLASLICVALSLPVLVGCGGGGGPKLALVPASGVVTLDGAPLPNAVVTFYPQDGKGIPAIGTTDDSGKFSLSTKDPNDGVLPGLHQVSVKEQPADAATDISGADAYAIPDPKAKKDSKIPAKYSDPAQSGLNTEIKAEGSSDIKLELSSK